MSGEVWALLASLCWGIGGFFEKKGMHMGNIPPEIGITIRTAVALGLLFLFSLFFSNWGAVASAPKKALLTLVLGGGVVGGTLGMLFFYKAIKAGTLGVMMAIAFSSPIWGAIMGVIFMGDKMLWQQWLGLAMVIGGVALLMLFKGHH